MNRRKFLKQVALWSAGLLAVPPVFDICPEVLGALNEEPSELFVAKGKKIPGMVAQLVDEDAREVVVVDFNTAPYENALAALTATRIARTRLSEDRAPRR